MKFDAYEFIAVVIPGALPTLTAGLLIPEVGSALNKDGIELGDFGILLIVSFVVGHVVQVFGNWIEKAENLVGFGMVSMVDNASRRPVDEEQWGRFCQRISDLHLITSKQPTSASWPSIRREVYATLEKDGRTDRIDAFNRTYGLCRGMVAGVLISSGMILAHTGQSQLTLVATVTAVLAIPLYLRMRRFSSHYFRELVAQFLAMHQKP